MKIDLIRTAHPRKIDYEHINNVRKKLKCENATSKSKIKEIFEYIGVELDLDSYLWQDG